MTTVQVTKIQVTEHKGAFVTDASDIGFRAGEWPDRIVLVGETNNDLSEFWRGINMNDGCGEFYGYVYIAPSGTRLTVMNY